MIPFVVDTVGNIGPEATLFLDDIFRFVSLDKCKFVKLFTDCLQIVLYSDLNIQCSKFYAYITAKLQKNLDKTKQVEYTCKNGKSRETLHSKMDYA